MHYAISVFLVGFFLQAAAQNAAELSLQGQAKAQTKQLEEAERLWKEAISLSPRYFPALFNLGYLYFTQQKFTEAEPLLRSAARNNERDFNSRYLLGLTLARLDRREDALLAWREALRLEPNNLRLLQIMSVEYSKGRYFSEAAQLAKEALDLEGGDQNLYFLCIKAFQDAGDLESATAIALRAVLRFPESARANFEYGFQLQHEGKLPEALSYLTMAMKADPAYEEPFFFYGSLLLDQGQGEEAIPYLRTALRNRSDYVPAKIALARALISLQRWQEAISELNGILKKDPDQPQPHLLLSQVYFRLGDEAKAKAEQRASLQLRRQRPALLEGIQSRPFPELKR